jgi:hypothetical protein
MKWRELLGVDLLTLDLALNGHVRPRTTHGRVIPSSDASKPVDPERVQAVFLAPVDRQEPAERLAFLDRECAAHVPHGDAVRTARHPADLGLLTKVQT